MNKSIFPPLPRALNSHLRADDEWLRINVGGALTLKQTRLDVGWKMEAYQEAITFGNATESQKQQVSAAYKAYQLAFRQALAAANGNLAAPSPANVQQLANQLIATVDGVLSTLTRLEPFPRRTPLQFRAVAGV